MVKFDTKIKKTHYKHVEQICALSLSLVVGVVVLVWMMFEHSPIRWIPMFSSMLIIGFAIRTIFCWRQRYFEKSMIKDFLTFLQEAKMPLRRPKVLYLYTTKNDFNEHCLEHNLKMKRKYRKIEVWIIDASTKEETTRDIQLFLQKHKSVKYFKTKPNFDHRSLMINHFLASKKPKYDFLLIGDINEIIADDFIKINLKLFYSKKISNLAYITPIDLTYNSRNLYSNVCRHFQDLEEIAEVNKNIEPYDLPAAKNNICLLNGKFVKLLKQLPTSNILDIALEEQVAYQNWCSIASPLSTCFHDFETNPYATQERIGNRFEFKVKMYRNKFKWINENYLGWNGKFASLAFLPIIYFFTCLLVACLAGFIYFHITYLNDQNIFRTEDYIYLGILAGIMIICMVNQIINNARYIGVWNSIICFILKPFYASMMIWKWLKTWCKLTFSKKRHTPIILENEFSKYIKKNKRFIELLSDILTIAILGSIIVIFTWLIFFYLGVDLSYDKTTFDHMNRWDEFVYDIKNVSIFLFYIIFGFLLLSSISSVLFSLMTLIPTKLFSKKTYAINKPKEFINAKEFLTIISKMPDTEWTNLG